MITQQQAQQQLDYLYESGFFDKLSAGAAQYNLSTAFVIAISSRETNCTNIIGDFQGSPKEAHGIGIMQIDIQNPIAKQMRDDGTWKTNPDPLINFGCNMLSENIATARKTFPQMPISGLLKIAASGYNAGIGRAVHSAAMDGDSDACTTGRNYGADVISRMALFAELIGGDNASQEG